MHKLNKAAIKYAADRHISTEKRGYAHEEKVLAAVTHIFKDECSDGFIVALALAILDQGMHSVKTQDAVAKAIKDTI